MGTWNTRGLRGSALEDLINLTNDKYREKKLALIQKIPTPIKPIRIDKESRHITLAYFEQKSTVDYIGAVQGIPVCFDAKECATDNFPLANVHPHQIDFMEHFEEQGGVAFLLIHFTGRDILTYLPYRHLRKFWDRMKMGGRKHFKYGELDSSYELPEKAQVPAHYLEPLNKDLMERKIPGQTEWKFPT